MARAEHFMAVLEAPSERRHRTGGDAGAFSEGLCRLARGGCPEHLVAGRLEPFPHRRKGARLARAGNSDHQVQGMAGSEQALGHFGLSLGETEAPGKLCSPDGRSCASQCDGRPRPLGQACQPARRCGARLRARRLPPKPAPWHQTRAAGRSASSCVKHLVNCAVQERDRQAVQMRRHSHDDVARVKVFSEASRPPGPSSSAARPSRTSLLGGS